MHCYLQFFFEEYKNFSRLCVDTAKGTVSQPVRFNKGDDLYYYETDFRKRYGATFPIGLWVDLPDDKGVYHKWLICRNEPANQFPKYLILPANYELMWVEKNNEKRIKRRMWCVLRQQI